MRGSVTQRVSTTFETSVRLIFAILYIFQFARREITGIYTFIFITPWRHHTVDNVQMELVDKEVDSTPSKINYCAIENTQSNANKL